MWEGQLLFLNKFIQQECIKLIKSDREDVLMLQKNPKKRSLDSTKSTIINIYNNKKCFLSTKSAY